MVDVSTEILIKLPLQVVVDYTSNPDNAPHWYVNIKSVRWKTSRPLNVDSQIVFVAHFLGRKLEYTYEVVEMSNNKFVRRTAQGPFPMETTYHWDKIDSNTTRMTLINSGQPKGFSKLLAPFMSIMMRKANEKDLKHMKQLLEKN